MARMRISTQNPLKLLMNKKEDIQKFRLQFWKYNEYIPEYMQSFGSTHQSGILKEPLRSDDVLSIMVTDKDMQVEVFNALQKHRKV